MGTVCLCIRQSHAHTYIRHRYYVHPTNKKVPRKWLHDESGAIDAADHRVGGAAAAQEDRSEFHPLNYGARLWAASV